VEVQALRRAQAGADVQADRAVIDLDQPIGFRIGQRIDHDTLHHGEDRRIRPDGQRECGDGREGERGRANQPPRGMPQLLLERIHESHPRRVVAPGAATPPFSPSLRNCHREHARNLAPP